MSMKAREEIEVLQSEQLEHDQLFHADILCLSAQKRACHMTLHIAKYSGQLTVAKQNQDRDLLSKTVIDTFIIFLATSNIFNKSLSEYPCVSRLVDIYTFNELAKNIESASTVSKNDIFTYASEGIAIQAGRMSKAIESLDHLENFPFVDCLLDALNEILEIVLVTSFFLGLELQTVVRERLREVEKKSIFFSKHRKMQSEQDSANQK